MKKTIVIDGVSYVKSDNEVQRQDYINGQEYALSLLIAGMVMFILNIFFYIVVMDIRTIIFVNFIIIYLMITMLAGGIGFDSLDYLNERIDKIDRRINK